MAEISLSEIPAAVDELRTSFVSRPRRSTQFVKTQLLSLKESVKKYRSELIQSLVTDFNRAPLETVIGEFAPVEGELTYLINNLSSLTAPEYPTSKPFAYAVVPIRLEKEALGTILIVSPFNFPLLLSLSPLVGALSAGNNVVLKLPYDRCPTFCSVLTKVLSESIDPEVLKIVNGGLPESKALLEQKYDKIMFTGSTSVGKIVHAKAAESLTPTLLELGGKSPTFLTASADLEVAITRILWGTFFSAGQACTSPDYLLIQDTIYDKAISTILKLAKKDWQFDESSDYTHIINADSYNRLTKLLETTNGQTIFGGKYDAKTRFLSPTIVADVDWTDPLMKDEVFGPILPVLKYSSLEKTVEEVQKFHDTPLATYVFSNSQQEIDTVKRIRSGALLINDTMIHPSIFTCPFGGVGTSGMGAYHGQYSIDTFSHKKIVLQQPKWYEALLKDRYPPYTQGKIDKLSLVFRIPNVKTLTSGHFQAAVAVLLAVFIGFFLGKRHA
ncbi:hypothetical protein OGAPHI_004038 [Ogataea philodendri]|uniref:Aldehyde dehydrogenase n=1 Tax=Ogataea philodendri TaxID=1378263 RepID=A0A9P8P5Z7_9ASCO|nr:uncharacterized protein OGAPHI_004038 [Ogataea philodendri]KAH3665850.1 hypothetical protein OGAPHI_004038 [Ogataea philodendri]